MKTNFVDAIAKTVVRPQFGLMLVGVESECNRLGAPGERAKRRELLRRCTWCFACYRIDERSVGGE
jgi:hypothetical protein